MTAMQAPLQSMRFADLELRPTQRELLIRGEKVELGARAFDVLQLLAERSSQIVSRKDLLEICWRGLVVEDGNLSVQMSTLRKLLGPDTIKTIPGVGYRFSVAPEPLPVLPAAAAPVSPPLRPGNLPLQGPQLIGRDDDIARVAALVREHRVVSIVGAGGIGKTRLSQAVAQAVRDDFAGGVWLVELASVASAELVVAAVAQALGLWLPDKELAARQVIEALPESTLLVLDNCEQVVEAVDQFVQELIQGSGARVLLTSQVLLKRSEEHVHRLDPLSVPVEGDGLQVRDHGAVQLLEARVAALEAGFRIDARNAADAAEVCRELDGLPLAIELAAARVPLLGLAGVRERLGERLRLLTGGSRSGPARHRTMRAALAWSHSLLAPAAQVAFRRLSVFAGSFGVDQAEALLRDMEAGGEDAMALLGVLVDQSLLMRVDRSEPQRHRLLQSAREYAAEMLEAAGEAEAVRRRHAEVMNELFLSSLQQRWAEPSQRRLRRFLPDLDNVRAALAWAAQADAGLHASLAGASGWLFGAAGQCLEGRKHCREALSRPGPLDARTEARLQHTLGMLLHDDSSREKIEAARRAVVLYEAAGDDAGLYAALGRLAISASLCDEYETAQQAVDEMEALWRRQQETWPPLAYWDLLNARDYVANLFGRLDEGKALAQDQMELAEEAGDTFRMLFAMMAREQCTATDEDYASAVVQGRALVALARHERYAEKLHVYIANLATALMMDGQLPEALEQAGEAFKLDKLNGSVWQSLDMLAMLAFKDDRPRDAAVVLGRAEAANSWRGENFREPVESHVRQELMAALQTAIAPDEREQCMARGAAMSNERAAEIALKLDRAKARPAGIA